MTHEENSAGEIPPCLIGEFRCKNAPLPYVHQIEVSATGGVVSVDMVRVRIDFAGATVGEELAARASMLPTMPKDGVDGYRSYTAHLSPGKYRIMSTYAFGDSCVVLGIGLVGKSCKVDMSQGFVEFNPNKVAQENAFGKCFRRWCALVSQYVCSSKLVRWDLAYDLPVSRSLFRVEKDRRHYKLELSASMTEYLGRRNAGGYVKVYDKAAELGLEDIDMTRIELTCDGDWPVGEIGSRWPNVYQTRANFDGLSSTNRLLAGLLVDKIKSGETIEPELKAMNKRTRKKMRLAIEDLSTTAMPEYEVGQAKEIAEMWAAYMRA